MFLVHMASTCVFSLFREVVNNCQSFCGVLVVLMFALRHRFVHVCDSRYWLRLPFQLTLSYSLRVKPI